MSKYEQIRYNGKTFIYNGRSIQVIKNGKYKGADGNYYPYANIGCEGPGADEVWGLIRELFNNQTKEEE